MIVFTPFGAAQMSAAKGIVAFHSSTPSASVGEPDPPPDVGSGGWGRWLRWGRSFRWFRAQQVT